MKKVHLQLRYNKFEAIYIDEALWVALLEQPGYPNYRNGIFATVEHLRQDILILYLLALCLSQEHHVLSNNLHAFKKKVIKRIKKNI